MDVSKFSNSEVRKGIITDTMSQNKKEGVSLEQVREIVVDQLRNEDMHSIENNLLHASNLIRDIVKDADSPLAKSVEELSKTFDKIKNNKSVMIEAMQNAEKVADLTKKKKEITEAVQNQNKVPSNILELVVDKVMQTHRIVPGEIKDGIASFVCEDLGGNRVDYQEVIIKGVLEHLGLEITPENLKGLREGYLEIVSQRSAKGQTIYKVVPTLELTDNNPSSHATYVVNLLRAVTEDIKTIENESIGKIKSIDEKCRPQVIAGVTGLIDELVKSLNSFKTNLNKSDDLKNMDLF